MKILCHRGMWGKPSEKNNLSSLMNALDAGFGIETDVRDLNGDLVISHDMATSSTSLLLSGFLSQYSAAKNKGMLALNIKSDGLHGALKDMLAKYSVENYFVFDMSVPDTLGYINNDFKIAIRLSEFEGDTSLLDKANFVWLDSFADEWYTNEIIVDLIESKKEICIVSPELHGREVDQLWDSLRKLDPTILNKIYLCTDYWDKAKEAFNV